MSDYIKGDGALFPVHKKADNYPDYRGHLTITREMVAKMIEVGKAGHEIKIQVAFWHRQSKGGQPYLSGQTEVGMPREQDARQQAPRQQSWQPQQPPAPPQMQQPRPQSPAPDWGDDDIPF